MTEIEHNESDDIYTIHLRTVIRILLLVYAIFMFAPIVKLFLIAYILIKGISWTIVEDDDDE